MHNSKYNSCSKIGCSYKNVSIGRGSAQDIGGDYWYCNTTTKGVNKLKSTSCPFNGQSFKPLASTIQANIRYQCQIISEDKLQVNAVGKETLTEKFKIMAQRKTIFIGLKFQFKNQNQSLRSIEQ